MAKKSGASGGRDTKVTRYTYDDIKEPRTPETGHTSLLLADGGLACLQREFSAHQRREAE